MLKLKDIIASGHSGRSREWIIFHRPQTLLRNQMLDTTFWHALCSTTEATWSRLQSPQGVSRVPLVYTPSTARRIAAQSDSCKMNLSIQERDISFLCLLSLQLPLSPFGLCLFSVSLPYLGALRFNPSTTAAASPMPGLREGVESIAAQSCVMSKRGTQWTLQRRSKWLRVRVHSFKYPLRGHSDKQESTVRSAV